MPLPAPLLNGTRREYQISFLMDKMEIDTTMPGERRLMGLVLPEWQRPEEWVLEQKVRFIESIFLGLNAGYYVVNGADFGNDGAPKPMSGWLLDGQQRICAIRDFVSGRFAVFGDVFYADIDVSTRRRRFLRQSFPCFEIDYCENKELLKELYNRLNFGGTPHKADQKA